MFPPVMIMLFMILFPLLTVAQSSTMDWIWTDANRFVNESEETVIFHGVNIRDPHNLELDGHWTRGHFEEARRWGADIIRLPVHPGAWRTREKEDYLRLLDQGVQWARELGLYLIIDWHSIGNLKEELFQHEMYETTVEETEDFWDIVSQRYAREPVIAMYELYNEPTVSGDRFGEMTWKEWKAMNEEMIRIIRENHPRAVILVAGFDWAYDLTPVKKDPIDKPGIAYVSHPYPQKRNPPWKMKWEKDWGFVADTYPVILTEIGFALPEEEGVHVPVKGDETYGKTLVDYASEKGISWVVWCFDPDWAPYMFTDWDYTPTRQGAFFKKAMTGR